MATNSREWKDSFKDWRVVTDGEETRLHYNPWPDVSGSRDTVTRIIDSKHAFEIGHALIAAGKEMRNNGN